MCGVQMTLFIPNCCNNSNDFEGAQSLYKELNLIVQELYDINDAEYQILSSEYHEKSAV